MATTQTHCFSHQAYSVLSTVMNGELIISTGQKWVIQVWPGNNRGETEGEKQRVRDQKQRWQKNWIAVDNNLLWRSKAYTFGHFVCNLSGNPTHVQDTSCPLSDWCLLPNAVRDLLLRDSLVIFKNWSEWDKLHCGLFNSWLESRHLPKYLPFSTWLNLPRTKLIPIHAYTPKSNDKLLPCFNHHL